MKRNIILCISLVAIISLSYFGFCVYKKEKIEFLQIDSIDKLYTSNEIYVLFGSDRCVSCDKVKIAIQKNDSRLPKKIYYYNIDVFNTEVYNAMIYNKYDIKNIPCLLKIKDGNKISLLDINSILSDY